MDLTFELLCLTLSSLLNSVSKQETETEIFLKIEWDERDGISLPGKHSMVLMESLMTFTTVVERQNSTSVFYFLQNICKVSFSSFSITNVFLSVLQQ